MHTIGQTGHLNSPNEQQAKLRQAALSIPSLWVKLTSAVGQVTQQRGSSLYELEQLSPFKNVEIPSGLADQLPILMHSGEESR